MKTKKKVPGSTYEEFISDPECRKLLAKERQKLERSEALIEAMQSAKVSVRKLAENAGVSPTIIQELRTGKRDNVTLKTFDRVLDTIGYKMMICPKQQDEG